MGGCACERKKKEKKGRNKLLRCADVITPKRGRAQIGDESKEVINFTDVNLQEFE